MTSKKRIRLKRKYRKLYLTFNDLPCVGNFKNGYGVSVINDGYGSTHGLYELAVLYDDCLCYKTHITNDVLGWLTKSDVSYYMKKVQQLKG